MGTTAICALLSVAGTLEQPNTAQNGTDSNGDGELIRNQCIQEARKKQETAALFWSTCELVQGSHKLSEWLGLVFHVECVWHSLSMASAAHGSYSVLCMVCDRWEMCGAAARALVYEHRCCTWMCLPAFVTLPAAPQAGFQGSVLPQDQLSHDYVRDQRDWLSLILLTSVPTARRAATWIIEDIHMQIFVIITPNNVLCHPPESTESHVDSCFNPFWQSAIGFPAQELCRGLGDLGSLSPHSACWAASAELLSWEISFSARLCKTRHLNLDRRAWSWNRERTPDLIQKKAWLG